MTTILGINAYHGDASASLVIDGQLVAAVEEERFNRIKHWAGFPAESIRWCLDEGGVKAADIDHVAVSFDPRANMGKRLGFVLRNRPSMRAVLDRLNREVNTILAEPEMIAAHDRLGAVTLPMSRTAFRDFLLAEIELNAQILRASGVQPE